MAELKIDLKDSLYQVSSQGFYLEFPAGSTDNQKAIIQFLRSFKKHQGAKQGLFTQEQIAQAMADYKGATKQSIRDQEKRFEESGKNMRLYLNRKRKVDQEVVQAIETQLQTDPLASNKELASGVNLRLGRKDITETNVDAGLEQIAAKSLRKAVKQQMEKGSISYREEYLLEKSFSALQSPDTKLKQEALTVLERAEIKDEENDEAEGMKIAAVPADMLKELLKVDGKVEQIPQKLKLMVIALRLYGTGMSLSALGQLFGIDKTTGLRWVIGLAIALYPIVMGWIKQRVKGGIVYVDEKWIKIKGSWQYWFVALDAETRLPLLQELMPSRDSYCCQWILIGLKRIGYHVTVIVTDGLVAYQPAIVKIFKDAIHQLCLFHHQQNVSKFAKEHFTDEQDTDERKREMKAVIQTEDKRTVRNRLSKLETKSESWGIVEWVKSVTEQLPHLLPAVGSCRIPRTNNAIERFFRRFNQFYKTRNGFFSLSSAKNQLVLFTVFYLLSQGKDGTAPIEAIMPEVSRMPIYKLMNDPLFRLGILGEQTKENQAVAGEQLEDAA